MAAITTKNNVQTISNEVKSRPVIFGSPSNSSINGLQNMSPRRTSLPTEQLLRSMPFLNHLTRQKAMSPLSSPRFSEETEGGAIQPNPIIGPRTTPLGKGWAGSPRASPRASPRGSPRGITSSVSTGEERQVS
ncbi:unnamed protein product [Owenia fusiformis]|uniref:Uncharacterized protein n=1 Tax=Owenia fusiformis TaxID=6347 RepID=A0A8J1TZA0_OWEFU|nr:unnamed protein product [Owenia fusiformis]